MRQMCIMHELLYKTLEIRSGLRGLHLWSYLMEGSKPAIFTRLQTWSNKYRVILLTDRPASRLYNQPLNEA